MNIFLNDCEESFFEKSCCFTGYRPENFPFHLRRGLAVLKRLKIHLLRRFLTYTIKAVKPFTAVWRWGLIF